MQTHAVLRTGNNLKICMIVLNGKGSPLVLKNLPADAPWVGTIPWRRAWQPTPVFLPGESHGQRSLAGYSL